MKKPVVFVAFVATLMLLIPAGVVAAGGTFTDDDTSIFEADIEWLASAGVTKGCDTDLFCPNDYVTRGQMAAFIHRLSGGDDRTLDGRLDALEAGGGVPSDDLAVLEAAVASLTTRIDTLESKVGTLEAENNALKDKLAGVTRNGDILLFEGMNLQVVNGLDSTRTTNGLGNVIIGYNNDNSPFEERTGSHYLVLGDENGYTKYAGIIAGELNTASGNYASVLGGRGNTVTGNAASVCGGYGNTASANWASVSGGYGNTVSGAWASVSGGSGNTVSGNYSSVTGGYGNTVSGNYSSVTGGDGNEVVGDYDTVVGGDGLTTIGWPGAIAIGEGFWNGAD